jgi:mRNA-degrading endonuclease RelE of RelBE toxin-antitoxin system
MTGYARTYGYRIGDYRVVFEMVADEIVIVCVGRRDKVYRRLLL